MGLDVFVTNAMLGLKFSLLLVISGLLTYVYFSLQPRIDALFAQTSNNPVPQEIAQQIGSLRLRRKRMAAVCMFVVLTVSMFGVQVWAPFPFWLTVVLVVVIGMFTWRAYKSVTPYGWV